MRPVFYIEDLLETYKDKVEAQEHFIATRTFEPPEGEFRKLWNARAMVRYLLDLQGKRRKFVSMEDLERIEKELIE